MPRPGGSNVYEKSKDFFGSIKRLLSNLKSWRIIIIVALFLAMFSAILSLIAPNKLSDFTDIITKGLAIKTDKLSYLSEEIQNNFNGEKLKIKINSINNDQSINESDKEIFYNSLKQMQQENDEKKKQVILFSLPDSILIHLLDTIKIDGKVINEKDQLTMLRLSEKLDKEGKTEESLKLIDELPESIYSIIKPEIDMKKIKDLAILMIIIYVLSALFSYIQNYAMTTVSNNFARGLRSEISSKINRLPLKYFDSHETGDILSRVTNDIDTIAQNLNNSLATLVTSFTLFIGSIIMMYVTNWIMATTAILSSLVGFVLMFLILGKSQKYFSMRQKELGNMNGFIEEMYSGHNVIKAYNGTDKAILDFQELNNKLFDANRKSIFLSGLMQPIMGFVGNFGYVAVCLAGALLVLDGNISFGVIVAFMIYIRLFTNPLSQIAQAMTNLQSTAAASERVYEFLDEGEMTKENSSIHLHRHKVKGFIEFKNVKFGYDKKKTIIKNFSAKAEPGQKIAIVGPTGAGKTTMVNLLMKFYDINSGEILIDGVSTNNLTRENIHKLFIMVLQDTWLFEGSIRDNIKFNQENITDKDIWRACRTVGVDHFIKTLPGGLDALLNDNETISSGQKQLITIARGMIEDAPFLILDEATSNVDTRTEELVQKAMDKLMEGRTSFIIAHRLSTIKNADLILVMNDGNIIEQGNHEELINKNGFYAELYNSQFQK